MRQLIIGLIAGVLVYFISRWASARPASRETDGWRALKPGAALHATVAVSGLATAFCLYILFFVGSARADAAEQMIYLRLLIFAFAAGTLFTAWAAYATRIRWNDDRIVTARLFRKTVAYSFSDVRQVKVNDAMGVVTIGFDDDSRLRVSTWMKGIQELLADLSQSRPAMPRRPDLG